MYLQVLDLISLFFNKSTVVLETGKFYKADYSRYFVPIYQTTLIWENKC